MFGQHWQTWKTGQFNLTTLWTTSWLYFVCLTFTDLAPISNKVLQVIIGASADSNNQKSHGQNFSILNNYLATFPYSNWPIISKKLVRKKSTRFGTCKTMPRAGVESGKKKFTSVIVLINQRIKQIQAENIAAGSLGMTLCMLKSSNASRCKVIFMQNYCCNFFTLQFKLC